MIWLLRWHVARWMIHAALKIAAPGRARDELTATLWAFGNHVRRSVEDAK